jgi:hypothetical protein
MITLISWCLIVRYLEVNVLFDEWFVLKKVCKGKDIAANIH